MQQMWRSGGAQEAYKMALRILEKRQRSAEEMRGILKDRFCPQDAIDEVVERLIALGYINDHELAHIFMRKAQHKGWGPKRIRMELKKRGLVEFAGTVVEEAVEDYPRVLELVSAHREKGKTDQQITGVLLRLGHRRPVIIRALKDAPKSSFEMEMDLPPGLLDLDDLEFDFEDDEDEPPPPVAVVPEKKTLKLRTLKPIKKKV